MTSRALVVVLFAGCSSPSLELAAGRATTIGETVTWQTLVIGADALGHPARGEVRLSSPSATVDPATTFDRDGVAFFSTRCDGVGCDEPLELTATWNGVTTTRRRLARFERWADGAVSAAGGSGTSSESTPLPHLPGCEPGQPCVGEAWTPPPPEVPCVETSLGGTASLHLGLRGATTSALRVELSNGVVTSCREGVSSPADTTFIGIAAGRWTVRAWGGGRSGSSSVAVSSRDLVTEGVVIVR